MESCENCSRLTKTLRLTQDKLLSVSDELKFGLGLLPEIEPILSEHVGNPGWMGEEAEHKIMVAVYSAYNLHLRRVKRREKKR